MIVKVKNKVSESKLNNRWAKSDFATLKRLIKEGKNSAEIAIEMGRTYYSITKKRHILGLTAPKISKIRTASSKNPKVSASKKKTSDVVEAVKASAKEKGYEVADTSDSKIKDKAKTMTKLARQIARVNGKRITMAMFFVEDL
jgi:capsular polysaccharide biosynthesis protein